VSLPCMRLFYIRCGCDHVCVSPIHVATLCKLLCHIQKQLELVLFLMKHVSVRAECKVIPNANRTQMDA
jgi:hypothetical protein